MLRRSMIGTVAFATMVGLFAADALRADAQGTLADSYRLQFENDRVKVIRVHYPAGVKLPDHSHPAGLKLYVYLNDSEGIVYRHSGSMKHVTHRPPVKAGSMRISGGPEEHHTAENMSATAADHLRIELKTVNVRVGRRIRAATFQGDNSVATEFTNDAVVIQRIFVAPGKTVTADAIGAPAPSLWIALPSGETRWSDAASQESLVNTGTTPMEVLRVIVS